MMEEVFRLPFAKYVLNKHFILSPTNPPKNLEVPPLWHWSTVNQLKAHMNNSAFFFRGDPQYINQKLQRNLRQTVFVIKFSPSLVEI